jgi:geranylgeranyl pyrophosphate synthase
MSLSASAIHSPSDQNLISILKPVSDELRLSQDLYRELLLQAGEKEFFQSLLSSQIRDDVLKVAIVNIITNHLMLSDGKWIRAALVLLGAGLFGVKNELVRRVAVAVELVHLATLVHDDVIDQAPMRRGVESIPLRWGNSVAVLIGDLLLSKAFGLLLLSQSKESQFHMMRSTNDMCLGEIKQLSDANPMETSELDYMQLIEYKTASLMGAASGSGGSFGNLDPELAHRITRYGYSLGMAFQIVDDILDYTSSLTVMGKEQGGDLKNGKATLPLIHFIQQDPLLAKRVFDKPEPYNEKALRLVSLMKETGSIDYAYGKARDFAQDAKENLAAVEHVSGSNGCFVSLHNLVDFILHRNH